MLFLKDFSHQILANRSDSDANSFDQIWQYVENAKLKANKHQRKIGNKVEMLIFYSFNFHVYWQKSVIWFLLIRVHPLKVSQSTSKTIIF